APRNRTPRAAAARRRRRAPRPTTDAPPLARAALRLARWVTPGQLLDGLLAGALGDEDAAAGPGARVPLAEHVGLAAAAENRRDRDLGQGEAAHVADERPGRVPADEGPLDEVVGEPGDAGEAPLDRIEDLLLALRPVPVVLARRARVVPDP